MAEELLGYGTKPIVTRFREREQWSIVVEPNPRHDDIPKVLWGRCYSDNPLESWYIFIWATVLLWERDDHCWKWQVLKGYTATHYCWHWGRCSLFREPQKLATGVVSPRFWQQTGNATKMHVAYSTKVCQHLIVEQGGQSRVYLKIYFTNGSIILSGNKFVNTLKLKL